MTEFNVWFELREAILIVGALMLSACLFGSVYAVIYSWPHHWDLVKARWFKRHGDFSTAWRRQLEQNESRIEFHSQSFTWPIQKDE